MASKESSKKIMLVTLEPVSKTMAGPAIRCLELAKQLACEFDVSLLSPVPIEKESRLEEEKCAGVKVITGLGRSGMYNQAMKCDILVIQSNVLKPFPKLAELGKYLAVDLYDPYLFAVLVQYQDDPVTGSASYRMMHGVLNQHMISADFSMCASETQRDYWLGRYCTLGRLTPEVYKFDPSLRSLIDVVPFGLQTKPIERNGPGIRNNKFGITDKDKILLWGGGIWDWFDPLTVIEAVNLAKDKVPELKLYFMGWKSPNPKVEVMDMAHKAKQLSKDLGIIDKHVFFEDDWIPYDERVNYLLDADIAVSSHFDLPETRFSFRTRILDYLYAGLPVLTTGGDTLGDQIEQCGAGFALPYKDPQSWAESIVKILSDEQLKDSLSESAKSLAKEYSWDKTSKALVNFCRDPHKMPSHIEPTMPNIVERARAVYSRGGTDLVLKRSKEIITDLFK